MPAHLVWDIKYSIVVLSIRVQCARAVCSTNIWEEQKNMCEWKRTRTFVNPFLYFPCSSHRMRRYASAWYTPSCVHWKCRAESVCAACQHIRIHARKNCWIFPSEKLLFSLSLSSIWQRVSIVTSVCSLGWSRQSKMRDSMPRSWKIWKEICWREHMENARTSPLESLASAATPPANAHTCRV